MRKTAGNPFFVNQFLHALHEEKLLTFATTAGLDTVVASQHTWQWDTAQIETMKITDNVVDLMIYKMRRLPAAAQRALRLAACVGNHFDLDTLSIISEKPPTETFKDVEPILAEGFILPTTDLEISEDDIRHSHFRFLHDRVQQAAYTLIDDEQKQAVHLQIGRLLLANTTSLEGQLFEIVDQLNEGATLIDDEAERLRYAELNLQAGKKAKESVAYLSSVQYLRMAMNFLPENYWEDYYDLAFTLYQECAESEFLSSNFEAAESICETLLSQARSNADKLKVYHLEIALRGAQTDYICAIELGFQGLQLLGVEVPPLNEVTDQTFLTNIEEFKRVLGERERLMSYLTCRRWRMKTSRRLSIRFPMSPIWPPSLTLRGSKCWPWGLFCR